MALSRVTIPVLAAVLAATLSYGAARAEQNAVTSAATTIRAEGEYAGYVAGFNAMNLRAGFEIRPDGYRLGTAFTTSGFVGAFMRGDNRSRVEGSWRGAEALPQIYEGGGIWLGEPRHTEIRYPDGQPHLANMMPQIEANREPVPPAMQRDTKDVLSSAAMLLQNVARTGRCEGHARTFDGHRLTDVTAHTVGMETLPPESRSSYTGPALRCDLDGRLIAGFMRDAGPDDMIRKPQHSSIWFAQPQPGLPMIPVLMSFEVRVIGHVNLYLTAAHPAPDFGAFKPLVVGQPTP